MILVASAMQDLTQPRERLDPGPLHDTGNQGHQENQQKNIEENLGNACRRNGNSRKTEEAGHQGHDEKYQCPSQHGFLLSVSYNNLYPFTFVLFASIILMLRSL